MKGLGRGFESLIPTELIDEEFDITAAEGYDCPIGPELIPMPQ